MTHAYSVTNKAGNILAILAADTYQDAAVRTARQLHGRNASAMRTTGTIGMSGWFQAYVPVAPGSTDRTSAGAPFHIAQE